MKLSDLTTGMTVLVDQGFDCMAAGPHIVETTVAGSHFLRCAKGGHYLAGQEDENGELVGISLPGDAA